MADDINVGVRFSADGKNFIGTARLSRQELKKFQQEVGTTQRRSQGLTERTRNLSASFAGLRSKIGLASGALAAFGLLQFAGRAKDTLVETERLQGSLVTFTDSAEEASNAFSRLEAFASTTPFALEQSVQAFVRMKSLGLDPTEEALRSFGNTAAATQNSLLNTIEAVADASTFQFERLREFGITTETQGDRIKFTFQGVTTEVQKSSEAIVGYLQDIGDENFGGAMEDQMERLPGLFSNLSDEVNGLVRDLGEAGLTQAIGGVVKGMISLVGVGRDAISVMVDFRESVQEAAKSAFSQFQGAAGDAMNRLREFITGTESGAEILSFLGRAFEENQKEIRELSVSYNMLKGNTDRVTKALDNLRLKQGDLSMWNRDNSDSIKKLKDNVVSTFKEISQAIKDQERLNQAMSESTDARDKVATSIEREQKVREFTNKLVKEGADLEDRTTKKLIQAYGEKIETLQKLEKQYESLEEETKEAVSKFDSLFLSVDGGSKSLLNYGSNLSSVGKIHQSTSILIEKTARQFKSLRLDIDRANVSLLDYTRELGQSGTLHQETSLLIFDAGEEIKRLNRLLDSGAISQDEWQASVDRVKESVMGLTDETKNIASATERTVQRVQQIVPGIDEVFRSTARTIFSTMNQAFRDIVTDTGNLFENLKDRILDIFLALASQLASIKLFQFLGLAGPGQGGGINLGNIGSLFSMGGGGGLQAGLGRQAAVSGGQVGFAGQGGGLLGSLGPILGAAGLGFAGGGLLQNLLGGNQLGGGIGGALGAGGGFALGAQLGAGLGPIGAIVGGLGGSLLGGLFGNNTPPNLATAGGVGTLPGQRDVALRHGETSQEFDQFAAQVESFGAMVNQLTGDVAELEFRIDVGVRDGIQVLTESMAEAGEKHRQFAGDAEGSAEALRFIMEDIVANTDSISDAAKNVITSFEGANERFSEFAAIVLNLENRMEGLSAIFGDISLEGFSNIADQMGLEQFLSITDRIATELGKTEEIAEINIRRMRDSIGENLEELGTTVESFWEDLGKAIEEGLTEEELKLWMELVPVIDNVTEAEEGLKQARLDSFEATMKERKAANDLTFSIRDRIGLISDEEKERRRFNEQQKKDREENRRLLREGIITQEEARRNERLLVQERRQHNKEMADLERQRQQDALRIQRETNRQFQQMLRQQASSRAQQRISNQQTIADILRGGGGQNTAMQQLQGQMRDIQNRFAQIAAGAAPSSPFISGQERLPGASRLEIQRLAPFARQAGESINQLVADFEFFQKQVRQIASGSLAPEMALLKAQQREQMQRLNELRATGAQRNQLAKQHAKQRQQLMRELNRSEKEGNNNLSNIAQEREQLIRRRLALQGRESALRNRQIKDINASNRALQRNIWVLEDQQAMLQERETLIRQQLSLQGAVHNLRSREIKEIDASNRHIQRRIWALEDEQAMLQEREALIRQQLSLQGSTINLRKREIQDIDEANRHVQRRIWALEDEQAAIQEVNSLLPNLRQFLTDVELGIRELTNPVRAQFDRLIVDQQRRAESAEALGIELERISELNRLEQEQLIQNILSPLEDFLSEIRGGGFSQLPVASQFEQAQQRFSEAVQQARAGEINPEQAAQLGRNLLDLSRQMFASGPEFFEQLQFVERTVENLMGQVEQNSREQLDRAAKDETLLSIGQEIIRGNEMSETQLKEINRQLAELRNVNDEMRRELLRARKAA